MALYNLVTDNFKEYDFDIEYVIFGHFVMICMHIKLTNAYAVNNSLRIRCAIFFS
jgi:hypothetical protein